MKLLLCSFVAFIEAGRVQDNAIDAVLASDFEAVPGVSALEVEMAESDVVQSDEFQSAEVQSDVIEGMTHPTEINVLHHNPHWECFERDASERCKHGAYAQYTRLLTQYSCDFSGMLMGGPYVPPSNYGRLEHLSGKDKAVMMFRKSRWDMEAQEGGYLMHERSFIAARFRHKEHTNFVVVVVAAHYDHATFNGQSAGVQHVRDAVHKLSKEGHFHRVVILADTNQLRSHKGARQLLAEVGASTKVVWGDDVFGSCCLDGNFAGGGMSYDRAIANFGKYGKRIDDPEYMKQTNRYQRAPQWAYFAKKLNGYQTAAYHHPVLMKVTV